MTNSNLPNPQKYFSVKQFSERHNLGEGSLRHLIFFKDENNFKNCIVKVGKKIYISEEEYFKFMEANRYAS